MEAAMGDTPTKRINISELPESLALDHLASIRDNRLRYYKVFKAAQEEKLQKKLDRATKSQLKAVEMLEKELASLDKLILKIEDRCKKVQACRIQAGTLEIEIHTL